MRSKDLAKASGLAVAFDHTAPKIKHAQQGLYWLSTRVVRVV